MSSAPTVPLDLAESPRPEPLRVEITAVIKEWEGVAVALALKIAKTDARLSLRKLQRDPPKYLVETNALTQPEQAIVIGRIRDALGQDDAVISEFVASRGKAARSKCCHSLSGLTTNALGVR
jgi:hypothetical protein